MITFSDYLPQSIFLLQGDEGVFEALCEEHPRTHALSVPRFTVDHARHVAQFASEGSGEQRMLVVHFAVFSPDAAQVLLKSLEEPAADTTIIFITPYPYVVPLTIRSRVMMLSAVQDSIHESKKYTKASATAFIKDELSSESDDDAATRRARAIKFLDDLEQQCAQTPAKVRTVYEAKSMLLRANLPTKYVAEYVVSAVL